MPVFTALWHLGAGVYPYPMNRLRRQPFPAPLEAITIRWIQLIVNVSYTAGLRGGPLTHVLIRSVLLFGQSTLYTVPDVVMHARRMGHPTRTLVASTSLMRSSIPIVTSSRDQRTGLPWRSVSFHKHTADLRRACVRAHGRTSTRESIRSES